MNKLSLRRKYSSIRDDINPQAKKSMDQLIYKRLLKSSFYQESKNIFIFVSFSSEVDTHKIIRDSLKLKNVYVPLTLKKKGEMQASLIKDFDELASGPYKILAPKKEFIRPVDKNQLDLVIVPGLAFDRRGYRLGYGGGYYDIFLKDIKNDVIKLGICYDIQVEKSLEAKEYDIPVDYILTEKGIYKCEN